VDTSEEKDLYEDIDSVKAGGHFLTQNSTVEACRSGEFLMPQLCDRNTFETWAELGRPNIYSEAEKKVEEILATPQRHPLSDDVIGELQEIIRRAEEELD
jgi:trimethylamine:corrinoid methyltransferase-like protein